MTKKWYILHVYSGYEQKVKTALLEQIETSPNPDKFGKIVIPTEQVIEVVRGKKKTSDKKFYPGYILINMELDHETWYIVNSIPKITGFLGNRTKPSPISDKEASQILERIEAGKVKPKHRFLFNEGDDVRVIDGPFTNFNGTIEEINIEKGTIKVSVSIFGRPTPLELDFAQATKI